MLTAVILVLHEENIRALQRTALVRRLEICRCIPFGTSIETEWSAQFIRRSVDAVVGLFISTRRKWA